MSEYKGEMDKYLYEKMTDEKDPLPWDEWIDFCDEHNQHSEVSTCPVGSLMDWFGDDEDYAAEIKSCPNCSRKRFVPEAQARVLWENECKRELIKHSMLHEKYDMNGMTELIILHKKAEKRYQQEIAQLCLDKAKLVCECADFEKENARLRQQLDQSESRCATLRKANEVTQRKLDDITASVLANAPDGIARLILSKEGHENAAILNGSEGGEDGSQ